MTIPKVTRTYGPIHFEDLDPHRFEDLVRELIYDYRDWQSIEATGRSGSDEGFDIRAYERARETPRSEDEEEEIENARPMDGNLWMIQCKREKEIGPKRVANIISDAVDSKDPPYGYILAAATNFSKESYDAFRLALQARGVMEFYIWGRAELEDMLHLPKNDRILFTFFGISLVSRRRSLATEMRFTVNNKNKLIRILDGKLGGHQSVLVRDLKDTKYPYKEEYRDFKDHPRWKEYKALELHPLGLILQISEHYAYVDPIKKEWDFTKAVNLIHRESDSDVERKGKQKEQENVEGFWDFLPHANQAKFEVYGMIRFDEMAVIDDKGDTRHDYPHIFVDFRAKSGPFQGFYEFLKKDNGQISLDGLKQSKIFPDNFSKPKVGTVHQSKSVLWDDQTLNEFKNQYDRFFTLYDCDDKYNFLKPRHVISVANTKDSREEPSYIQITYKTTMKVKDYLEQNRGVYNLKNKIELQIGRGVQAKENIDIYEFKRIYAWQFDPESKL